MKFATSFVPDIRFGEGVHDTIAVSARALGAEKVLVVIDGFLAGSGFGARLADQFAAQDGVAEVFSGFAGEPKLAHVRAASAAARCAISARIDLASAAPSRILAVIGAVRIGKWGGGRARRASAARARDARPEPGARGRGPHEQAGAGAKRDSKQSHKLSI